MRRTPTPIRSLLILALLALPVSAAASDFDKDGVADLEDDCPTDKGTKANKGCPGEAAPAPVDEESLIEVSTDQFNIKKRIEFEIGSAKLRKSSENTLFAVSQAIQRLPPNKVILIRGHTDNRGKRQSNIRLSKKRAAAVRKRLINGGIDKARLRSEGLGPDEPIADNATAAGRARNRRVEFKILDP